jgi:hypothetical protein
MTQRLRSLPAKAYSLLESLSAQPFSLLCVVLAANALAQPYAGFSHDSRLYAAQVVEKVRPGTFAEDLFLRFGSQDRYSVFTPLVAPAVALCGLEATFFCLYLASKAFFFWGLIRLTRAVIPDGPAAVLSLLYIAIVPLPFGGNEIFHLNEPFLTPRIAACGLVFLGLERMLAGRLKAALALLAGALVLHPLMAFGAILLLALWWSLTRLTRRQFAGLVLAVCAAAALVLAYEPLGARVFGRMDDDWRDVILTVCFFVQPQTWAGSDWVRIAWCVLVVGVAAWKLAGPTSTFVRALLLAAVAGMVGSCVGGNSHYRLLIQTSPYRTIWLTELLAVPLAFWAGSRLWRHGTGAARCASLGLVLLVTCNWGHDFIPGVLVFLALWPAAVVAYRGLSAAPRYPDWPWRSGLASFLVTFGLMLAYNLAVLTLLVRTRPEFHLDIHPTQVLMAVSVILYKPPVLAGLVVVVCALLALLGCGARFRLACLAVCLGYQTALTCVDASAWYGNRFTIRYSHRHFVASFLRDRSAGRDRPVTVYWPEDLRHTWFDAQANCYFNPVQLSGCAFNRGTALEGQRRALLVRRFDIEGMRTAPCLEPWWQTALYSLYRADADEPAPTAEDLFRLCREDGLDYVVLEQEFEELHSASDGRYFIYDCRHVRSLERTHKASPRPDVPPTARADRSR